MKSKERKKSKLKSISIHLFQFSSEKWFFGIRVISFERKFLSGRLAYEYLFILFPTAHICVLDCFCSISILKCFTFASNYVHQWIGKASSEKCAVNARWVLKADYLLLGLETSGYYKPFPIDNLAQRFHGQAKFHSEHLASTLPSYTGIGLN